MMYFIVYLSILFSISQSIDTFVDNEDGNILSFNKDHGWKFYENEYSITDRCQTTNCQVDDTINNIKYYGPFKKGILYLARDFACNDTSKVTVNYDIIYCDTDTLLTKKDFVRAFFENMDDTIVGDPISGTKYQLNANPLKDGSTLYDINLIGPLQQSIFPSPCLNWKKYSISDPIQFNAYADKPFEISFKLKLNDENNFAFINNIELNCNEDTENEIGSPQLNVGGTISDNSKEYCISGLPVDDINNNPNGQYLLRTDSFEDPITKNGEFAFEQNDPFGNNFLFESSTINPDEWIISSDIDGNNIIAKCNPSPGVIHISHNELENKCQNWLKSDNTQLPDIKIIADKCYQHTVIGSLFGLFPTDINDIKVLTLLISLSILSCIIGMMTCYCCQLICGYRKTKNYKKVSDKDVDIDF